MRNNAAPISPFVEEKLCSTSDHIIAFLSAYPLLVNKVASTDGSVDIWDAIAFPSVQVDGATPPYIDGLFPINQPPAALPAAMPAPMP